MAEFINQIPGYEYGRVQRISASAISAPLIVAQMAIDLWDKWNTKVLCISLDEHKDLIEDLILSNSAMAKVFILNQKNPDIAVVLKKVAGYVHRKSVHAVIISGAERLRLKTPVANEVGTVVKWLERVARKERIPLILVENNEIPADWKCPLS